jgi:hypothetical protein
MFDLQKTYLQNGIKVLFFSSLVKHFNKYNYDLIVYFGGCYGIGQAEQWPGVPDSDAAKPN